MVLKTDDVRVGAWRNFITLYPKLIAVVDLALAESGQLRLQQYDILFALYEAEGRLRLHELALQVLLSRSSITRLVDQLEASGLLRREPDPEDRRGAYAVLTDAGRAALRATWPVYAAAIHQHFGCHLTDDEAAILKRLVGRMLAAF